MPLTAAPRGSIVPPMLSLHRCGWWTVLVACSAWGAAPRQAAADGATHAPPRAARAAETGRDLAPATLDSLAIDDELGASKSAAWVPARPIPESEPWELAVRAPERIATLPL